MKYKIGDRLLIKSKIITNKDYGEVVPSNCESIKVTTSCSNGYDTFDKSLCTRIEDGYVIHEVIVRGFDTYKNNTKVYHTTNELSASGMGWQGVDDCDVIEYIGSIYDINYCINLMLLYDYETSDNRFMNDYFKIKRIKSDLFDIKNKNKSIYYTAKFLKLFRKKL